MEVGSLFNPTSSLSDLFISTLPEPTNDVRNAEREKEKETTS